MLELGGARGGAGVDTIQTKQKGVAREQKNKYKPRTKQAQLLSIRHAGMPADFELDFVSLIHC